MLLFPYLILWLGSSNRGVSYYLDNNTDSQSQCSPVEMQVYGFDWVRWRLETEAEHPSSGTAVGPTINDNAVGVSPQRFPWATG